MDKPLQKYILTSLSYNNGRSRRRDLRTAALLKIIKFNPSFTEQEASNHFEHQLKLLTELGYLQLSGELKTTVELTKQGHIELDGRWAKLIVYLKKNSLAIIAIIISFIALFRK